MKWIMLFLFSCVALWLCLVIMHLQPNVIRHAQNLRLDEGKSNEHEQSTTGHSGQELSSVAKEVDRANDSDNLSDDTYHLVFSTGCSEFQDWQSIGVYSSAEAIGQKGVITRIASGCTPDQEKAIRHAMSHLPKRFRVHFAPNTQVKDHSGHTYKYANKPLGMMHWLTHADPPIPPTSTVALLDPDFFFLRPLWHDSFDHPSKYITSGSAKNTPMPPRITRGVMVAQKYGIGGSPWRTGPGLRGQKAWGLKEYLTSIGRPTSPALAEDLTESTAGTYYSFGAPYIALASDWLPIATNWTALMPMAVERNFGNLAEMYACSIAVADYGIRPVLLDSLMVSNVDAGGEGWPWIDVLPMHRGCDPTVLTQKDPEYQLPTFLHYCQTFRIPELEGAYNSHPGVAPNWKYSKYAVPDGILHCPAGSKALEGGGEQRKSKKLTGGTMALDENGFLPDLPTTIDAHDSKKALRNIFATCVATRATNQAAKDYRRWFCDIEH